MSQQAHRIEFIQGMGRGVKRVVESEKGRERDRLTMSIWREGGRGWGGRGSKRERQESKR